MFKYSWSQWPLESGISTFPKFLLYIKRNNCYVHLDGYSKQLIIQVPMWIQGYNCIAGGSIKCCSYFEKQSHRSSKIKRRVFCDPAVQLLDIYPRERKTHVQTKAWIWMFIEALFIPAKMWKQSMCLSTDEWISNMWSVRTAIKTNGIRYRLQQGWALKALC